MIAITVFIVEFKLDPDLFSALMPYFGILLTWGIIILAT